MTALSSDDSPVYIRLRSTIAMFVMPGAAEALRIAERENFVTTQWPRILGHIDLLGLNARDLLERERV
jgi:GntR family transcriptional regulator